MKCTSKRRKIICGTHHWGREDGTEAGLSTAECRPASAEGAQKTHTISPHLGAPQSWGLTRSAQRRAAPIEKDPWVQRTEEELFTREKEASEGTSWLSSDAPRTGRWPRGCLKPKGIYSTTSDSLWEFEWVSLAPLHFNIHTDYNIGYILTQPRDTLCNTAHIYLSSDSPLIFLKFPSHLSRSYWEMLLISSMIQRWNKWHCEAWHSGFPTSYHLTWVLLSLKIR